MTTSLSSDLNAALKALSGQYYRLALVVGPAGSGKTPALITLAQQHHWPRLNVNLRLAESLLELTPRQRTVQAAALLEDRVRETAAEIVILDHLEMLFAVELALDPLRLLQALSRHRVIIAAWPGYFAAETLTYAEPGHPEARRYFRPDACIVPVIPPVSAAL